MQGNSKEHLSKELQHLLPERKLKPTRTAGADCKQISESPVVEEKAGTSKLININMSDNKVGNVNHHFNQPGSIIYNVNEHEQTVKEREPINNVTLHINTFTGRESEIVKQNVKQNVQYEELAKPMKFPCNYETHGCQQRISFEENLAHEENCSYQKIRCPNFEVCTWTGMQNELLNHFQQKHPENVVQNPMKLTHNIQKTCLQNYLMTAFQVLFLIQTKVCLTTRAIYHSVWLIGDSKRASMYSFDLDIENENGKLSKYKVVTPLGSMGLQLTESIMTDFNLLLSFLGKLHGVTFTLTVRTIAGATVEQIEQGMKKLSVNVLCVKCQCTTHRLWRDDNGWYCKNCRPVKELVTCNSSRCNYKDIVIKYRKHNCCYCPGDDHHCISCNKITRHLEEHLIKRHAAIVQKAGSEWTAEISNKDQWSIIKTKFGKVFCHYWMYGSKLFMYIRTPLSTEQLYMYKCVVEISHPTTRKRITCTAEAQYFYAWDWELNKPDIDIYDYADGNQCNVKLDFIDNVFV